MLIPDPLPQNFGERLRCVRVGLLLAQGDAARKLAISAAYLCRIERGKARPGPKLLRALAAQYGLPGIQYAFGQCAELPDVRAHIAAESSNGS